MPKKIWLFILIFIAVFALDQLSKFLAIEYLGINKMPNFNTAFKSEYMDLVLVYNDGVAFSMLSFLKGYLKYLHLFLLLVLSGYLLWQKSFLKEHFIAFAMILAAGSSNLLDRFVHVGVVDMFFWHKWFEFAVFNVADVMINIGVALIIIKELFFKVKKAQA
ncbi:lipoprotein signal peptidase [Campylobacter sp. MIT 12-5580]|uniref:signal peptidase II n=1 Tax=Campylobacter sp. MIT 12-5580 TaxID=2040651 RepID=UPI0010F8FE33|nr:signal peptidase II [Campylobacter sp. MIT 12-5580]TKX28543.1 lipoprotein signal peptidase [Campylobacter sp. MIT 12-5580]